MSNFAPLQHKSARTTSPVRQYTSVLPHLRIAKPSNGSQVPKSGDASDQQITKGFSFAHIPIDPPVETTANTFEERRENHTGLPDKLKAGIESLSGISLADVHVHYNSPKPAKMLARAYTQGTDIHVGPGQEKHLSHEAWHVVQQRRGRVHPTLQTEEVKINADRNLEREADIMGYKALSLKPHKQADDGVQESTSFGVRQIVEQGGGHDKCATAKPGRDIIQGEFVAKLEGKTADQVIHDLEELGYPITEDHEEQIREMAVAKKRYGHINKVIEGLGLEVKREKKQPIKPKEKEDEELIGSNSNQLTASSDELLVKAEEEALNQEDTEALGSSTSNEITPLTARKWVLARNVTAKQERFNLISFAKAQKNKLKQWSRNKKPGKTSVAGSHHKFPKRTLGWLHEHMTETQKEEINEALSLKKGSGPKSWSKLASNLIPWGAHKIASDERLDDPEHTGEWLDLVEMKKSRRLTPRSQEYKNLAFSYQGIRSQMEKEQREMLTDEEARTVGQHLLAAQLWHHAIEKSPTAPANYGENFWKRTPDKGRKWVKGMADDEKYEGKERNLPAYRDAMHWERQREEEKKNMERDTKLNLRYGGHSAVFW